MEFKNEDKHLSKWWYFRQLLYLIPLALSFHYLKITLFNKILDFQYNQQTSLDVSEFTHCKQLSYEIVLLRKELNDIKEELYELQAWKNDVINTFETKLEDAFNTFYSDNVGMFDYASEYAGASIISTPDTLSYVSQDSLVFFGTLDWMLESQPNVILQTTNTPGQCYAFYGNKGRIRIKLGRPIVITHVSLEHIRIGQSISNAPKNFEVLGFVDEYLEESLGNFEYDIEDNVIQTFKVAPKNQTFKSVELRILSNYGNEELTCVYRFRVHSSLAN